MSQTTIIPKINDRIESLQNDVKNLRSLVIGVVGKDKEGFYRPSFVKRILKAGKQGAEYTFENKVSFMKQLKI